MISLSPAYLLYFVPLLVSISVVFGFTRHEDETKIFKHVLHTARWICMFMLVIFVILAVLEWIR